MVYGVIGREFFIMGAAGLQCCDVGMLKISLNWNTFDMAVDRDTKKKQNYE